jgi:hypothetical protein
MSAWLTVSDVLADLEESRFNHYLTDHDRRLAEIGRQSLAEQHRANVLAQTRPAAPDTPEARRVILAGICSGMTLKAASEAVGWSKSLAGVRAQRDPTFRQQIDDAVKVRESNARRKRRLRLEGGFA